MTRYPKWSKTFKREREAVAEALQVTTASVLRWESGIAQPDAMPWRDPAVLCGTSVPELLSPSHFDPPTTRRTADAVFRGVDPFLGHLGLRLAGAAQLI